MATKPEVTYPYKMGGPTGAVFFSVFFTSYTYFITIKCHTGNWDLFSIPWLPCPVTSLWSFKITLLLLLWFGIQCVLYLVPVGELAIGVKLESGNQLTYRLNAFFVLCANMSMFTILVLCGFNMAAISGHLLQLLTSSVVLISTASGFLYVKGGFAKSQDINKHGNSDNKTMQKDTILDFDIPLESSQRDDSNGNVTYDWFMGRELNPRWGHLDFKYILFRCGIIGWIILNSCNVIEDWQNRDRMNVNLVLVAAIQLFYVMDYFWLERGVIVSRDIVTEGLGYNIGVQFVMIPFCFCVQTRYIMTQNYDLNVFSQAAIVFIYGVGYYIYRASNSEKNNFRKNPDDLKLAHLKTMTTSSGRRLLISGWWGRCRHPNYLGDLVMSLSYALATGFNHLIPYLGTLFLVLLLVDREKQDGSECRRKYGADWDRYCKIVRYRIVPGLY